MDAEICLSLSGSRRTMHSLSIRTTYGFFANEAKLTPRNCKNVQKYMKISVIILITWPISVGWKLALRRMQQHIMDDGTRNSSDYQSHSRMDHTCVYHHHVSMHAFDCDFCP